MQGGCRDAEWLQGCRVVTGIGVTAGLQKSCRDGVTAEMGRVAGMQGGCRDAERLQGCSCYSCGDGVIAEVGWLQECRVVALMQGGCRMG